eukprot:gene3882-2754_t
MEDVADGLQSAWKETLRGLKQGYRLTKKAMKKIPPIIDPSTRQAGAAPGGRGGSGAYVGRREDNDSSDTESTDSEILSDEQVKELVDCKFFDPEYDPVAFEVEHLPEGCPREEKAIKAENAMVDQKILVLRQQCEVVSTTLKKRVLAHQQTFVTGIEQIRQLNDSLLETSSDCKKCRNAVRKAKAATVAQLDIIAKKRAVDNAAATVRTLEAMQRMLWKRTQLRALLARGKMVEASDFLVEQREIDMEDSLSRITCMQEVLEEWKSFVAEPKKKLQESIESLLHSCFTHSFMAEAYQNVVEASYQLSSSAESCSLVEMLLWQTAVRIFTRSFIDVSSIKEETAAIPDIVAAVEPEHISIAVTSMTAKWMDFFFVFATVRRLHEEALQQPGEALAGAPQDQEEEDGDAEGEACRVRTVHRDLLERVRRLGPRLAKDLMLKIMLVISSCTRGLASLDSDRLVHVFVVLHLAIEAMTRTLEPDSTDVKRIRKDLLDALCTALRRGVCLPDVHQLVHAMNNDPWEISDLSVSSLSVLSAVRGTFYEQQVQQVAQYLSFEQTHDTRIGDDDQLPERDPAMASAAPRTASRLTDSFAGGSRENPFRTLAMAHPQDTSTHADSMTFGQFWSNEKAMVALQPSAALPLSPPTVISASGLKLFRSFLSAQLKMVARFPPLVDRVLAWCEEWVCLYVFTIIDNFVSISRSIPVEDQGDFTAEAQNTLRTMRQSGEMAIDARDGMYRPLAVGSTGGMPGSTLSPGSAEDATTLQKFPPRVIERIRSLFVSVSQQYALGCRAVACESARAVAALYESVILSFRPLIQDEAVIQYYRDRCHALYRVSVESLHVCLHRLSEALLPMTKVWDEVSRLKVRKDEVEVSPYAKEMLRQLTQLHTDRFPMPTPDLETLFIQRSIFAVQSMTVREYSKLSKKVSGNDMMAMQLQVDAQNFFQQAGAAFSSSNVVLPRHVLTLVKTGFFLEDKEQSMAWMEREHTGYNAADMLNWFSAGERTLRMELEVKLKRELHHLDCLPLKGFLHYNAPPTAILAQTSDSHTTQNPFETCGPLSDMLIYNPPLHFLSFFLFSLPPSGLDGRYLKMNASSMACLVAGPAAIAAAAVGAGWAWMHRATLSMGPARDHWGDTVFGHRGCRFIDGTPENTLPAFERAVALGGCSGVEFDVRLSKDNRVVVHHDLLVNGSVMEGIDKLNAQRGSSSSYAPRVDELTADELQSLRFREDSTGQIRIPTLEEVVQFGRQHQIRLLIEIKEVARVELCVEKILECFEANKEYLFDHATVISFNPRALYAIRQRDPRVAVGQLYSPDLFRTWDTSKNGPLPRIIKATPGLWDTVAGIVLGVWSPKLSGCSLICPKYVMYSEAYRSKWLQKPGMGIYLWGFPDSAACTPAMRVAALAMTTTTPPRDKKEKVDIHLLFSVVKNQTPIAFLSSFH